VVLGLPDRANARCAGACGGSCHRFLFRRAPSQREIARGRRIGFSGLIRILSKIFIQTSRLRCLSIETVNGDEHSNWFEKFYEAKASGLILYGRALGLSHGEAEDVLQETFLGLMQSPEFPREPENYCVRSFRNRALNYKRSLWRRLTRELESARWFEKSPGENPAERAAMD